MSDARDKPTLHLSTQPARLATRNQSRMESAGLPKALAAWLSRWLGGLLSGLVAFLFLSLKFIFLPLTVVFSTPDIFHAASDISDSRWELLHDASTYEEWEAAGGQLDDKYNLNDWRQHPESKLYAWQVIRDRLGAYAKALSAGDAFTLQMLLQSGLVRNLGNITNPELYSSCFVGTKHLIEHYTLLLCDTIHDLAQLPSNQSSLRDSARGLKNREFADAIVKLEQPRLVSSQDKRQFFENLRLTYGRTALVFQGGSVFGLCHLGVAKALLEQNLLPKVVVGTGTGALMAALIGVHTDEELSGIFDGTGIDFSAFAAPKSGPATPTGTAAAAAGNPRGFMTRLATVRRRLTRFWTKGYFLDVRVLEQCVMDNKGDLTFEEAYKRTGRDLCITVVSDRPGLVPPVFNHTTTPHVIIWTAAVASNVSEDFIYGHRRTQVLCKRRGQIVPYRNTERTRFRHWSYGSFGTPHYPLQEVRRCYQVSHFIISQARPYFIPFVRPSPHSPTIASLRLTTLSHLEDVVGTLVGITVRYQAEALLRLGLLSQSVRNLFLDEKVPSSYIRLVPPVQMSDFPKLLDSPDVESLAHWISLGEKSVWPAVAALKIRCSVELQLEQTCQQLQ